MWDWALMLLSIFVVAVAVAVHCFRFAAECHCTLAVASSCVAAMPEMLAALAHFRYCHFVVWMLVLMARANHGDYCMVIRSRVRGSFGVTKGHFGCKLIVVLVSSCVVVICPLMVICHMCMVSSRQDLKDANLRLKIQKLIN
jgi:hypothetical protein